MSDSEDDQHGFLGTALHESEGEDEPLRARRKQIPVSEQIATDERGRRRFHGAFTGGFSAGNFNSVGTESGFTPATFVSSRSSKRQRLEEGVDDDTPESPAFSGYKVQKPEDFMDKEDMSEFGIAPHLIRPKGNFDLERKRGKDSVGGHAPSPGMIPGVTDIFRPVRQETLGVKLLMRMGWKPGQGIGPRLTRQEKQREKKRVYSCLLPPGMKREGEVEMQPSSETEDEGDEDGDLRVTYAPEDLPQFLISPKTNTFGLGYVGLSSQTLGLSVVNPLTFDPGSSKTFIGGKLGIGDGGVLAKSRLGIRGQAFGVGAFEKDDDDIYSHDDMSKYDFALEPVAVQESPSLPAPSRLQDTKMTDGERSLFNLLAGFTLASKPSKVRSFFPPPALPRGYAPRHKESVLAALMGRVPQRMPALQRQEFFTIPQPQQAPSSGGLETGPQSEIAVSNESSTAETKVDTKLLLEQASKPFQKDPEKQRRYEQYLVLRREGKKAFLKQLQPPRMTEWERENEAHEFERAAVLFKPLSGGIASRFVSSHFSGEEESVLGPSRRQGGTVYDALSLGKDPDTIEAAKMKMYGHLTRESREWYPDKLICKRFNIADPYPDSDYVGTVSSSSTSSKNKDKDLPEQEEREQLAIEASVPGIVNSLGPPYVEDNIELSRAESVQETVLSAEADRPSMDLFKAIFGESDDEGDVEAVDASPNEAGTVVGVVVTKKAEISDTDLVNVGTSPKKLKIIPEPNTSESKTSLQEASSEDTEEMIGPLPAQLTGKEAIEIESSEDVSSAEPETLLTSLRQGILSGIDMGAVQAHWKRKAEELLKKREEKLHKLNEQQREAEIANLGVINVKDVVTGVRDASTSGAPMVFQGFGGKGEGPVAPSVGSSDSGTSQQRIHWLSAGAQRMLDRYLPQKDLKRKMKKKKKDGKEAEEEEWVEKDIVDLMKKEKETKKELKRLKKKRKKDKKKRKQKKRKHRKSQPSSPSTSSSSDSFSSG